MDAITDIIQALKKVNAQVNVVDDQLKIVAKQGALNTNLIALINTHKIEIIDYVLKSRKIDPFDIPTVANDESYSLSSAQYRLWIMSQFEEANLAYNMPGAFLFEGQLNVSLLERAFYALIQRHEILRTVFKETNNGEVRQFINPSEDIEFRIIYHDLRKNNQQELINEVITQECATPFELTTGPLLRSSLIHLSDDEWIFVYVMHHIINDGWSMEILVNELLHIYNSFVNNETPSLKPLRIQYKDFASWQQKFMEEKSFDVHRKYWTNQFDGTLPVLEMPLDKPRPLIKTYNGQSLNKKISDDMIIKLESLIRTHDCSLFIGLTALVNSLLYCYTGQEDIIIGSPIAGRDHIDLENQIGFYVNTLALRSRFNGQDSFTELLLKVKKTILDAYEHQVYPFDELLKSLYQKRDLSRSALFDTMVVLNSSASGNEKVYQELQGVRVIPYERNLGGVAKFDLTFTFQKHNDGLNMNIEFNTDLFAIDTINLLSNRFEQLLESITAYPDKMISKISMLNVRERQFLLEAVNCERDKRQKKKTIIDLFEEQVKSAPETIAVIYNKKRITYKELNESVNCFANYLRFVHKVKPSDLICINLDRSEWMIISILGILKSGCAYIPIDSGQPKDRLDIMIENSNCKLIIDAEEITRFRRNKRKYDDRDLNLKITPSDLAYIIYTSGSTGLPKGCMINHGSLNNYIQWANSYYYKCGEKANFGLFTSISFDLTVTSLLCSLTMGGQLTIYDQELDLTDILRDNFSASSNINSIKLTPSHVNILQQLNLSSSNIQIAIVGGEELLSKHVSILKEINPLMRIYNEYGPTEATVGCVVSELGADDPIVIGKPISGTSTYVLTDSQELCPVGIFGELYISGECLSAGYLGNSELTSEKFIPNPYEVGKKMYKSGDIVRVLHNGDLEYRGRKDEQVKIRGHRIELKEIEVHLQKHENIESAVVSVHLNEENEKELVAYIVSNKSVNSVELRNYLGKILPFYMVPSVYVQIESIPLTVNGKLDKTKLPVPGKFNLEIGVAYVEPRTATEARLLQLWKEILVKERIGIKDDFFDLGGHSIKAMRLISQIHKHFEVKLGLKNIFSTPVLENQAKLIDTTKPSSYNSILPVADQEGYVLSSSQRRIWILSQLERGNVAYNMPGIYIFEGDLNRQALEHSFRSVIARHEILRTVFKEDETGEVKQYIHAISALNFNLEYKDLRYKENHNDELKRIINEFATIPFDLSKGPLVKASLYQLAENKWLFNYVLHHIISDGWSMEILIKEVMTFYNSYSNGGDITLPPLLIQYKDYANWQQQELNHGKLEAERSYWLEQLKGELPVLAIPTDLMRLPIRTYNGGIVTRSLSQQTSNGIKMLSDEQGCSLFMGLLASVNVLLFRYTNQEDILIGSPTAGRLHADLENQIGFYLNTLVFRNQFRGENSFNELLSIVKHTAIEAYEHQLYPFDELIEELNVSADRSRHPLFDVLVEMYNSALDHLSIEAETTDLKISSYQETLDITSKFDLRFYFSEVEDRIMIAIEYNKDLFYQSTIDQLVSHLDQLMSSIVLQPNEPISKLDLLNEKEKSDLLTIKKITPASYDNKISVLSLFHDQVKKAPDNIALLFEGGVMTYRELDEKSDRLAHYLQTSCELRQGDPVAIMLDRSTNAIIAILGVMKSQGAYVPIDPTYPESRKAYIMKDCQAKILLTQFEYTHDLKDYGGEIFAMDIQLDSLDKMNKPLAISTVPKSCAYIIYTSGSSGTPKGCSISHLSLSNYIKWANNYYYGADCQANFGLFTSLSFDLTVTSIFCSLTQGFKLKIYNQHTDLSEILRDSFNSDSGINSIKLTPSHINILAQLNLTSSSMKCAIVGGEELLNKHVNILKQINPFIKIYNEYGPTEATVGCVVSEMNQAEPIVIGHPIEGCSVFILDNYMNLCPVGVYGELYISGECLSLGYFNNPELTSEKFVQNPYLRDEKMYKSGDIVRLRSDGNIEYKGRKDEQVKIRGYRIELAEIETSLQKHANIESAIVTVHSNVAGEKELVAYFVSDQTLNGSELRNYLSKNLPLYMLPSTYIQIASIPLTVNGKLDKTRLPASGIIDMNAVEYVEPSNPAAAILIEVLEDVLKKNKLGMRDDFFLLGGDSIKAIQVVSRLKQKGYTLTIQHILEYPLIEELAARLKRTTRLIDQNVVIGEIPLSPIQQYFLQTVSEKKNHFNQSVLLYCKEQLSETALRAVLGKLILHHDVLRMVYKKTSNEWIQQNKGQEQGFYFEVKDGLDQKLAEEYCDILQSSIDLENGPLFKAVLFKNSEGNRLLLIAHHLIIDGVSWRILFDDLVTLYQQHVSGKPMTLALKTDSFKHWQEHQISYSKSEIIKKEELYWSAMDALSIEPLPMDYPKGSNSVKDEASFSFILNSELTNKLLTQCYQVYHTNINDVLLTGLCLALKNKFDGDRVIVGMEGHGRESLAGDIDVTRTIGWFTTVYPVSFNLGDDSIRQLIEVKENLHRVPNKGIGYGILRYLTGKDYKLQPQINFNYLGDFGFNVKENGADLLFEFSGDYRGLEVAKEVERFANLEIVGMILKGELHLSIKYSKHQYAASTIQDLLNSYEQHLICLIEQLSLEKKECITPVDLTYKDLSFEQVDELNKENNLEDVYPLSHLQEGLYFLWLSAPGEPMYFEQTNYRLRGNFNIELLEKCYQKLVSRYAILRTHFTNNYGMKPLQVVTKSVDSNFNYIDVSNDPDFSIDKFLQEDRDKGFDLEQGSLMRLTILGLGDNCYEFVWSHHHILMDGWCVSILINEFFEINYNLIHGREANLKRIYPYSEYIKWLNNLNETEALDYWKNYLSGYDTIACIPKKRANEIGKYQSDEVIFSIKNSVKISIRALCAELGVTENTFIQTMWGLLLSKYNNSNDVVFGAIVSGRPAELEGIEEMIGLFINTIPVRINGIKEKSIQTLLKSVQQNFINSSDLHFTQLAHIQSQSELGRNLFDHILLFEDYPIQDLEERHIPASDDLDKMSVLSQNNFVRNNYDLTVVIVPGNDTTIRFNYNTAIYDVDQLHQLRDHFLNIIDQALDRPASLLREVNFLSGKELEQQLIDFNSETISYPAEATLVSVFNSQALKTPDAIALVYEDKQFSYQELDLKSNQLANFLLANYGLPKGGLIGIILDRTPNLVISILGILKAGYAYVPIDASYPKHRKSYIIKDTSIDILISESAYIFDIDYYQGNIFAIDIQLDDLENSILLPDVLIAPSSLAYVIYTSGSTGNPKGVMIEHQAIVNTILGQQQVIGIPATSKGLQFASPSFDASIWEMFMILGVGGSLHIVGEQEKKNPAMLEKYIQKNQLNVLTLPPSYLRMLDRSCLTSVEYLITAGEPAILEDALWYGSRCHYYNAYGPTETSICSCIYEVDNGITVSSQHVPIGKPLGNTEIYILDDQLQLLPIGVPGELCMSGSGLARGYLNQDELTSSKFVDHPYKPGERLYLSGDMARRLSNGSLEYLGRKDDQVKLKGYRIELGEIESVIRTYPDVIDVSVQVTEFVKDEKGLSAYIISASDLSSSVLQSYLREYLPEYMIPSHYIGLANFPLTQNGKIDKKLLPLPVGLELSTGMHYQAPQTREEIILVEIWQAVLNKEKIGITDNFFERGGDSIKILRMIAMVKKQLLLELSIPDVYKYNTIAGILSHLQTKTPVEKEQSAILESREQEVSIGLNSLKERVLSILPVASRDNMEDIFPMSAIEKGMLFESALDEYSTVYHDQSVIPYYQPNFSIERFRRAVELLVEKHAILRTSFNLSDYETEVQLVHKKVDVVIYYKELVGLHASVQSNEIQQYVLNELKYPFDPMNAPLWRLSIFNLGEGALSLVWQVHHSIIDGWSDALFMTELNNLYIALGDDSFYKPVPLKASYKDFIIQYEMGRSNPDISRYWIEELYDYSRLDLFSPITNDDLYAEFLEQNELAKLQDLAKELRISIKIISMSAYLYMLRLLNYDTEIVTGIVTNMRPPVEDGDKVLGCFLNTLPLRVHIKDSESCISFIKAINEKLIEQKSYEGISMFEISQLHPDKSNSPNPFFDTFFNYVDFHAFESLDRTTASGVNPHPLSGFEIKANNRTNTYLDFTIDATGGSYRFKMQLTRALKCGFSAEQVSSLYKKVLNYFINRAANPLMTLNYLQPDENMQLLSFNDTSIRYSGNKTVVNLFEEQVLKTPETTALVFETNKLSYKELNIRSNKLAHTIQMNSPIGYGDCIGVLADRSEWSVISMIAIMKLGCVYVPIDKTLPSARIDYMIKESDCKVIVCDKDRIPSGLSTGSAVSFISTDTVEENRNENNPGIPINIDSSSFIIYTSGSTGVPKGVEQTHLMLYNLIRWDLEDSGLQHQPIHLQFSSFSFDSSLHDAYYCLCSGGELHIANETIRKDLLALKDYLISQKISLLSMPYAGLKALFNEMKVEYFCGHQLREIISTGEQLYISGGLRGFLEANPEVRLYNFYGPSETHVVTASSYCFSKGDVPEKASIGKPIYNTHIYILDKSYRQVPVGIEGEIYIGGFNLANGYKGRPDLSSSRFIKDPFRPSGTIYKTGDIGKWDATGNIEYMMRIDDQVKVNGYRIELAEIESCLRSYDMLSEVVVLIAKDDAADNIIIAYVESGENIDVSDLRSHLKQHLPAYMIPVKFVQIQKIPLTPNGKIDKKGLLQLQGKELHGDKLYVAPRNETEKKLVLIWQKILEVEKIGIKDNFFELGGHSLKAMRLATRINLELGVKLSPIQLIGNPTIEGISEELEKWTDDNEFSIDIERETKLENDFSNLNTLPKYEENPVDIFITGCTGFIGVYLLKELMDHTEASIYCLVRAANKLEGKRRIADALEAYSLFDRAYMDRIIPVIGDLNERNLGISRNEYLELTTKIDVIYHLGANVSFQTSYHQVRDCNVGSCKEIIGLSITSKLKKVIHISTLGILSSRNRDVRYEDDNIDNENHSDLSGYVGSKWVAEKIMLKALDHGVPVQIHRLGVITGDNVIGSMPEGQWFYRLLRTCSMLGCYPKNFVASIAPVDYVARAILKLSLKNDLAINVFHLGNPENISLDMIFDKDDELYQSIKCIPIKEWLIKLKEDFATVPLAVLVDFSAQGIINFMNEDKELLYDKNTGFSFAATQATLNNLGLQFPVLGSYLNRYRYLFEKVRKNTLPASERNGKEGYPLSSSQQRFWVISQLNQDTSAYNLTGTYLFKGKLNFTVLKLTFETLLSRHESLRTIFKLDENGEIKQFIKAPENTGFEINYIDLRVEKESYQKVNQLIQERAAWNFNLETGPLLKVSLFRMTDDSWVFTYVMPHIIGDGWSTGVLTQEMQLIYNAYADGNSPQLIPLTMQYKEYAVWQQDQLKGANLNKHKNYWLEQFTGELPQTNLPGDKPRPDIKTYNGKVKNRTINSELSDEFKKICNKEECTLFMGLLAIMNVLIHKNTHQEDMIVGCPVSGREQLELEDQIGCFINIIAIRSRFKKENSFKELLANAKKQLLNAYENQVYPFDELVNLLNLKQDQSRSPLFDIMVSLHNTEVTDAKATQRFKELELHSFEVAESLKCKYDLVFNFYEKPDGIVISAEFNTDIFTENTMGIFLDQFTSILELVSKNCNTKIIQITKQIELIEQEKEHRSIQKTRSNNLKKLKKQKS